MIDRESKGFRKTSELLEEGKRLPYQAPAIVYEGHIDIRAGSPLGFTEDDPASSFTTDQ